MTTDNNYRFGTFKGVYTPSVLTILGVIMYLRMGWVVGNVGLFGTIVIVTISSLITLLTAVSISATATNMQVKAGGAYYMISRSLGVEIGAAVGIPLYLAQVLGVAFYIVGFSESLTAIFPDLSSTWSSLICLVCLTALAYRSADLALKAQYFVLFAIALSLFSFFWGSFNISDAKIVSDAPVLPDYSFWTVFAVFFPAVTGILSGVSMSGDLKDPSRSLPLGTFAAVITGYVIYLAVPIVLASVVPEDILRADPMVMVKIAKYSELIYLGIWGATLSSALGGLLAGPRILQALAKDSVVFKQLARTYGKENNPRLATIVSFAIALIAILLGDLNAIAPILSMFFLTSYGLLNFSAGIEALVASPSWRPKFNSYWGISMLGALLCLATMLMINPGATFLALASVILIYYTMLKRNMRARWDDMRHGIMMLVSRYSIYKLERSKENAKSWRPNILVLSGAPTSRWYLIEFAHSITQGKGFLTVASVLERGQHSLKKRRNFKSSIQEYLKKRKVQSLVEVFLADDINQGRHALIQAYGMGTLAPNTILLGETEKRENYRDFADFIRFSYFNEKNVVLLREGHEYTESNRKEKIHLWWGRERQNVGLMLALAYMIQLSKNWKDAAIVLNTIVRNESEKKAAEAMLENFLLGGRFNISLQIVIEEDWKNKLKSTISNVSKDADLVLIGMRPPDDDEEPLNFENYYRRVIDLTQELPQTAIVMAAQDIDFASMFS